MGNAETSDGKQQSGHKEKETAEKHSIKGSSSKKKRAKDQRGKGTAKASKKESRTSGDKSREALGERASVETDLGAGEDDAEASARALMEQRDAAGGLHASQAKIKVVGINSK